MAASYVTVTPQQKQKTGPGNMLLICSSPHSVFKCARRPWLACTGRRLSAEPAPSAEPLKSGWCWFDWEAGQEADRGRERKTETQAAVIPQKRGLCRYNLVKDFEMRSSWLILVGHESSDQYPYWREKHKRRREGLQAKAGIEGCSHRNPGSPWKLEETTKDSALEPPQSAPPC